MTDIAIDIADRNRLSELVGEWTQNQYLMENYSTMNLFDAILLTALIALIASAIIVVLYISIDESDLMGKLEEHHMRRTLLREHEEGHTRKDLSREERYKAY